MEARQGAPSAPPPPPPPVPPPAQGMGGTPPAWATGVGLREVLGKGGGELVGRLAEGGAPGVAGQLEATLRRIREGTPPGSLSGEFGVLADAAWEKLHTGNYGEVDCAWRDLFAAAAFARAGAAVAGGRPSDAMEHLDAALLFGSATFRPALQAAAEGLLESLCAQGRRKRKGRNFRLGEDVCLEGLPAGSLLREGGQPAAAVDLIDRPSLEEFLGVMQRGRPALILGAIDHWPALERWTNMEYLRDALGPRHLPVEVGRDYSKDEWTQKVVRLEHFFEVSFGGGRRRAWEQKAGGATSNEVMMYLAQFPLFEHAPQLRRDFTTPDYCHLSGGDLVATNAWLGPRGTVTPWHTDPHHNLLAQVVGQKYVRMAPPKATPDLYPFQSGLTTNTSRVDALVPDLSEFPRYADVPYQDCILEPGAMLYIPPGWWHYVQSISSSFSTSFWF